MRVIRGVICRKIQRCDFMKADTIIFLKVQLDKLVTREERAPGACRTAVYTTVTANLEAADSYREENRSGWGRKVMICRRILKCCPTFYYA
jgi:hypothetical protein